MAGQRFGSGPVRTSKCGRRSDALRDLQRIRDEGLVTAEEYDRLRADVLEQIVRRANV